MNKPAALSRRRFLIGGGAALGSLALPGCSTIPLPPTYGSILRVADNLTYLAHRTLLPGQSLVPEYSHKDISSFPAIGSITPDAARRLDVFRARFWLTEYDHETESADIKTDRNHVCGECKIHAHICVTVRLSETLLCRGHLVCTNA